MSATVALRDKAHAEWRRHFEALDRAQVVTVRLITAENDAWERYVDICNDLQQCTKSGCYNLSTDNVLCSEHR